METLLVQQQVGGDSWEPQLLLPSSHPGTLPTPPSNSCNHVHHGGWEGVQQKVLLLPGPQQ